MTDTIGQQLRQRREARRLSLEQVAQSTRIRVRYLQALEADQLEALPSTAQLRGFLRAYAQLLELPEQGLLAQLDGAPEPQVETAQAGSLQESAPAAGQAAVSDIPGQSPPQTIFEEIGSRLRKQREMLGLSLEDIEHTTHLRLHYLSALENGRLSELPSPVQGRGMLSNYASFLGLDAEPLLLRYADGLQAQLNERRASVNISKPASQPAGKVTLRKPHPLQRFFSGDLLIGVFLVVFLVGFIIWAALRVSEVQSGQAPTSTAPSVAEILAPLTPSPDPLGALTPTPSPESAGSVDQAQPTNTPGLPEAAIGAEIGATLEPTPTFPVLESGKIQLYLVARQRAWVKVTVDDEVELEGRVVSGGAYLFNGDERIELLTGNGAALQVFLNRQDLGLLGLFGEVVERVFTLDGMQTPTPAIPSTSTPAPSETPTATASGEVQPTGTPVLVDTPLP
jgi:cytoskeletal protein RodZ